MKFKKSHRREPTEPQLATMIDVFSILIIFLIAGTAMDSSVLNIPSDLILPETVSSETTVNAPQVTLVNRVLILNFIDEKISINELSDPQNQKLSRIKQKLQDYLERVSSKSKKEMANIQLLKSINLVADKSAIYNDIYLIMKTFKDFGFQNTILVGTDAGGRK